MKSRYNFLIKEPFFLRILSLRNIASAYHKKHPWRFSLIIVGVLSSGVGLYFSILGGFWFFNSLGGLGTIILKKVFYILFFILFFMLALSFGIVFYTCSFRSRETEFLFLTPLNLEKLIGNKFWEAVLISSWIPFAGMMIFLAAYSWINHLGWGFVFFSGFYLLPFLILSVCSGYFITLLALRFLDLKKIAWIGFFSFIGGIIFIFSRKDTFFNKEAFFSLSESLRFLKFSRFWFFPSYWVARGLNLLEEERFSSSFLFLVNLWSLGLLSLGYVDIVGKRLFPFCFYKYYFRSSKKIYRKGLIDKIVRRLAISEDFKAFYLKDIKLFLREPLQWIQFSIFLGLLFFYFLNLRKFSYHLFSPLWKNMLVFLNTFSVLCIISGLSIRFVFPQWSLEGKNFWILRLSPVSLKKIFNEKLWVFLIPFLFVCAGLIFISNYMLEIQGFIFYSTFFIVFVVCFVSLSLSLGLGAFFADFQVQHYLKSTETLGGFITLVVSFGYTVMSMFIFSLLEYLCQRKVFIIEKRLILSGYLIIWGILSFLSSILIRNRGLKRLEEKEP